MKTVHDIMKEILTGFYPKTETGFIMLSIAWKAVYEWRWMP